MPHSLFPQNLNLNINSFKNKKFIVYNYKKLYNIPKSYCTFY